MIFLYVCLSSLSRLSKSIKRFVVLLNVRLNDCIVGEPCLEGECKCSPEPCSSCYICYTLLCRPIFIYLFCSILRFPIVVHNYDNSISTVQRHAATCDFVLFYFVFNLRCLWLLCNCCDRIVGLLCILCGMLEAIHRPFAVFFQ